MKTKALVLALLVLLAIFQYRLWFSPQGIPHTIFLKNLMAQQEEQNVIASKHNAGIKADIAALKKGKVAIEEHARTDLGMVKKDEIFYQVVN